MPKMSYGQLMFDYRTSFKKGNAYERYVAKFLMHYGVLGVHVSETDESKSIDYLRRNQKDITVNDKVLEIKSRNIHFYGIDDFKYEQIFVDTVYGYEQKAIKPFAYIIVSQQTLRMFWLAGNLPHLWHKRLAWDRERHLQDEFYLADKSLCRPIGELLELLGGQYVRTN